MEISGYSSAAEFEAEAGAFFATFALFSETSPREAPFPFAAASPFAVPAAWEAADFLCSSQIFSISGSKALKSTRANRAGAGVTVIRSHRPNEEHSSIVLFPAPKAAKIFSEVSGIKLSRREAPVKIASDRL